MSPNSTSGQTEPLMAEGERTVGRSRPQRGATNQRLILALAASALLTAGIALPMAYQASEARRANLARVDERVEVLGTTTVRPDEEGAVMAGELVFSEPGSVVAEPLDGAVLRGPVVISLRSAQIARADFRLDGGPFEIDVEEPWQLRDGAPIDTPELVAGPHSITVTVTTADGRSDVRQAFFDTNNG